VHHHVRELHLLAAEVGRQRIARCGGVGRRSRSSMKRVSLTSLSCQAAALVAAFLGDADHAQAVVLVEFVDRDAGNRLVGPQALHVDEARDLAPLSRSRSLTHTPERKPDDTVAPTASSLIFCAYCSAAGPMNSPKMNVVSQRHRRA
jgi:hypothetical protein